ncbi:unnamed protein product, partial [Peniophora sp. CBMAI 1063]
SDDDRSVDEWNALPNVVTVYHTAERRKKHIVPDLQPHLLSFAKTHRLAHGAISHLPLTPTLVRANKHITWRPGRVGEDPFNRLPYEIWEAIFVLAVREAGDDQIRFLLRLASLNKTWANKIRRAQVLWRFAFASTRTAPQRFIVNSLAGSSRLRIRTYDRPRSLAAYLGNAISISIVHHGACWLQSLQARSMASPTPMNIQWLSAEDYCSKTMNIESAFKGLKVRQPVAFIPDNIEVLDVGGFFTHSRLRTFLNIGGHQLRELCVQSEWIGVDNHESVPWQVALQPLLGPQCTLEVLRVLVDDLCDIETFNVQQLDFPRLQVFETHSILILRTPPQLARASVTLSNTDKLQRVLPSLVHVNHLTVVVTKPWGEPLPPAATDLIASIPTFQRVHFSQLRHLSFMSGRKEGDAALTSLLYHEMSPRRISVQTDISSVLPMGGNPWHDHPPVVSRIRLANLRLAMDGLRTFASIRRDPFLRIMMKSWGSPSAIMSLGGKDIMDDRLYCSVQDLDGIHIDTDLTPREPWNSATPLDGSGLTTVHALSGLATEYVQTI